MQICGARGWGAQQDSRKAAQGQAGVHAHCRLEVCTCSTQNSHALKPSPGFETVATFGCCRACQQLSSPVVSRDRRANLSVYEFVCYPSSTDQHELESCTAVRDCCRVRAVSLWLHRAIVEMDSEEIEHPTASLAQGNGVRIGCIPVTYDAARKKALWYWFIACGARPSVRPTNPPEPLTSNPPKGCYADPQATKAAILWIVECRNQCNVRPGAPFRRNAWRHCCHSLLSN